MKKIAILGPYGVGNLGDAAIVDAMIQNIKIYFPDSDIHGININPDDTYKRHNIASFSIHRNVQTQTTREENSKHEIRDSHAGLKEAIRKIPIIFQILKFFHRFFIASSSFFQEGLFIFRSYRNIKGFDLLIVNGSGQLCDSWGGPWCHPYGLFRWALIAKAAGVNYVVLSVGAGPIGSPLSRFFIRCAMSLSSYRSFRNESSKKLVEQIGVTGRNYVVPDIAFSLPVSRKREIYSSKNSLSVVGLNPMAYYDPRCWPVSDIAVYSAYIENLAGIMSWLLNRNNNILLFSSDCMDHEVIRDVRKLVLRQGGKINAERIVEPEINSLNDLLCCISRADIVIGTRLHTLLLSALMYKPLLAISPHPKVNYLMEGLGIENYSMDINRIDLNTFQEKFKSLEKQMDTISDNIKQRVCEYQDVLRRQYERIFFR
jgi:polysaccharide pyruvyl transferase WcaK-like protein